MKYVLISGRERSGTTFLCNFLNSQTNVSMYTDIFEPLLRGPDVTKTDDDIIDYHKPLSLSEKKTFLEKIKHQAQNPRLPAYISKSFTINFDLDDFNTIEEAYYLLLNGMAKKNDSIVGHKVTNGEVNIPKLLNQTNVHVIYVYRDPRDVMQSLRIKFPHEDLNRAINNWVTYVSLILKTHHKNLLLIKYEDLIRQTPDIKKKLERFLETDVNFNIEKIYCYNDVWKSNTSYSDVNSVFNQNSIYRWKKNPHNFINRHISIKTKPILNTLNYEPGNTSRPHLVNVMGFLRLFYRKITYPFRKQLYTSKILTEMYRKIRKCD